MNRLAVFASGFGSNFKAIQDAIKQNELNAKIELLVSDKPNCLAIERAINDNIPVFSFNAKDYQKKEDFENEILERLDEYKIDLIVLAGYMRIIGETLLKGFKGKILNIHPSLLPLYKGKDAIGQALKDNAIITGVTIHYVNEELDSGEIIVQEKIDISQMKTRDEVEYHIHKIEHELYPKTIKKVLEELNEKGFN
jgi:phosphoribosylglycinamide formyltransferase-1